MSLGVIRDILNSKPFQLMDMSQAVNDIIPYKPGQAGALGLFREESLFTDVAMIEERQGVLTLVPTTLRGAPSTPIKPIQRKARFIQTFRLSEEDTINASELFKVAQFNSLAALENLATIRNQRLAIMADAMDMTDEHMILNALKGDVLDSDSSSLTNLFTLFGVSQEAEVAFDLGNATEGHLSTVLAAVKRTMLNNLEADAGRVEHIHVLCSAEFFQALVDNVDIRAWAKVPPNSDILRRSLVFGIFEWQGFVFEEYRLGTIASAAGGSWIATDKCVIFPVGPQIYVKYYSPGEYFATIGAAGAPRYARAAADPEWDEYIKLRLQSYPLPIVLRPLALMKGKRQA